MESIFLEFNQKEQSQFVNNDKNLVFKFLSGEISVDNNEYNSLDFAVYLTNSLINMSISEIQEYFVANESKIKVTADNIPQFSNFATAAIYLPEVLISEKKELTYQELGYLLFSETKSDGAAEKYGQNHGSLAKQLGLATLVKVNRKKGYMYNSMTVTYCQLEQSKKIELLAKLCFRIPIIQLASVAKNPEETVDEVLQAVLSKSTFIRRRSNVFEILAFALGI